MMLNNFEKFKTNLTNFKHYDLFLGSIILIVLFLYCFSYAYSVANNITFHPLNGDFQNYNILRRLQDGQFFAKDFNSYLGLGSMTFLYIIYLVDGGDGLSSSIFASYMATQLLFILSCLIFFKLFRINFFFSAIITFILYFCFMENIYTSSYLNLKNIILPDNSIYGLRMALPYLVAFAFYFCLPENLILTFKQKLFYSVISGISLLWSNDYSIPTYLMASMLFLLITVNTSKTKIKDLIIHVLISGISFIVLLSIVTDLSPISWINYNFVGVANDQYWYYLGSVIFEPSQLPINLIVIVEVLFALFLLLKKNKNRYLLAFIILSSIFAAYLSQIGGKISDRYFTQSYLLVYLISIGIIVYYLQNFINQFIKKIFYFIIIFCFIPYGIFNISEKKFQKKNGFSFNNAVKTNLNDIYIPATEVGLKLKEEAKYLSKDKRIFSEYSTLMDDIVGGFQPSGNDYIIHAMGTKEKGKYLSSFKELNPMFITTIRDDFVEWAIWSKRVNWYFFRELFASNYVPKHYSHYNIVWQRDLNFEVIKPISLDCKIEKKSNNETHLIFEDFITTNDFIADVEIEYDVKLDKTIYPLIGNRFTINIEDKFEKNGQLINRSVYGISPHLNKTNLMLEHKNLDIKNILKISTTPMHRTKLDIKSCSAKIIRFYNEKNEIQKLILLNGFSAFNLSDKNWKNGISIRENGFFIGNSGNIDIKKDDELEFPTGKRKVISLQDSGPYINIFVDGEKLDPIKDGYPNKIKLIRE